MSPEPDASASVPAAEATRMPLWARRLVLVGGLCVPVGLFAGPYVFGLQLLAVAGVVAIAVAFSYGHRRSWFSHWTWLTAAAGVLWVLATVAYWLSIMAAVDGSSAPSGLPNVVFYVGLASLLIMVAGVIAAVVSRAVARRRASATLE